MLKNNQLVKESIVEFEQSFSTIEQVTNKPNAKLKLWLLDKGSLTQKLIHHFGNFKVEVVYEGWVTHAKAKQFFRHALKDKTFNVQRFWLRKVNLICDGKIVVKAHTLVPLKTFHYQTKRIGKLQSKSLGQFLFAQKNIKRHPILIGQNQTGNWGRQSVFFIRDYPLLVTEYFESNFLKN